MSKPINQVKVINGYTDIATLPDGTFIDVINGAWLGYITTENNDKVCYCGVNLKNPTKQYINRVIINNGYYLKIEIVKPKKLSFEYCDVIKKCIQNCIDFGVAECKSGTDVVGDPYIWVSAEWVDYSPTQQIVKLHHHYVDTGRIAYSALIMETLKEKK